MPVLFCQNIYHYINICIFYLFIDFHLFIDFLYRKGKTKFLDLLENHDDRGTRFVDFFINMGIPHAMVDIDIASEFVCLIYSQGKVHDVYEARHKHLLKMTGRIDQVPKNNFRYLHKLNTV